MHLLRILFTSIFTFINLFLPVASFANNHPENTNTDIIKTSPDIYLESYFWIISISAIFFIVIIIGIITYTRYSATNKKLLRLLHLKSRFSNIGESINNISHQWKQPLNELAIQLMLMEKKLENDFPTEQDRIELRSNINKSHNILDFMADTVDVFGKLLNRNNRKSKFYPKTVIQSLLLFIEDNFKVNNIQLTSVLNSDSFIEGDSTELAHILLSILNNARDIFRDRDVDSPHVNIRLYQTSTFICIDITDNAGGITSKPISKVFKLGFSNKKYNESGIGLYIAKQLTEESFRGKIWAENTEGGAIFKITIPISSKEEP